MARGAGAFVFQFIDDFLELLKAVIPEKAPVDYFLEHSHILTPSLSLLSLASCDSIILSDSFQHSLLLF